MKKKFIDVKTVSSENSEIGVLCVDKANVDQLMSILQLAPVDATVSIYVYEEEVQTPSFGGFAPEKDA